MDLCDSLMATYAQPGMPGAAVLVVKDGRVVLEQSYGLAEVETRTPVTGETDFRLAEKPSKPDIDASRRRLLEHDEQYQLNSRGANDRRADYLRMDTTDLAAAQVAERIISHFNLPSEALGALKSLG